MLEAIIAQYGYVALFIGTFFEGEIVVIIAGLLVHLEYFTPLITFGVVFTATFVGDQFFFGIGRLRGKKFLDKRPRLQKKVAHIHDMLHRHQNKILFGFRFLYGLRIPTLIAIGTSEISNKKFVIINFINSIVWSILFLVGGYFFGDLLTAIFTDIHHYERQIFIAIGVITLIIWVFSFKRSKKKYR
jgi:membrane protein DedA with SNARE-associated domain